jgi:tRNA 2-thiocytidine biosynthesis protein TtcA
VSIKATNSHLPQIADFRLESRAVIARRLGVVAVSSSVSVFEPLSPELKVELDSPPPTTTAFNRLQKKLRRQVAHAIRDFNMIEDGDRVMVCLSGGKDSYTMLDILLGLQKIAPIKFDIVAVNLDQKQPNFPEDVLPNYLTARGVPHYILEKDTYSIVKRLTPEGKTYCAVCSRLRRGSLYGFAEEIGATKVALGHHRDDIIATFFLNLFHGGSLKAMPPKLLSDNGRNVLIRPLAYVCEKDIIKYAKMRQFPIIPCNLCGSQENLQRAMLNDMLREWDKQYPKRLASIFGAIQNVAPSQLADRELFDFESLKATVEPVDPEVMKNRLDVLNITLA